MGRSKSESVRPGLMPLLCNAKANRLGFNDLQQHGIFQSAAQFLLQIVTQSRWDAPARNGISTGRHWNDGKSSSYSNRK